MKLKLPLNYIDVSSEVTKADGTNDGIWYFGDKLNLNEDLIIGFSPTNYHCFIISCEYEFHARFSINPCKVQPSRKDNVRAALFFRYKGISKEKLANFQIYLESVKNKRTPSCHGGLLQVLSEGLGLKIPHSKISSLSPSSFLKNLWLKGLCDENGSKIPFEVYTTRNKSPHKILSDISWIEARYGWVFFLSKIHFYFLKIFQPGIVVGGRS